MLHWFAFRILSSFSHGLYRFRNLCYFSKNKKRNAARISAFSKKLLFHLIAVAMLFLDSFFFDVPFDNFYYESFIEVARFYQLLNESKVFLLLDFLRSIEHWWLCCQPICYPRFFFTSVVFILSSSFFFFAVLLCASLYTLCFTVHELFLWRTWTMMTFWTLSRYFAPSPTLS